jgi:hypothetical protein
MPFSLVNMLNKTNLKSMLSLSFSMPKSVSGVVSKNHYFIVKVLSIVKINMIRTKIFFVEELDASKNVREHEG